MSFLRRLFGNHPEGARATDNVAETADVLWIYVECARCGEKLRIRVNKANDLSVAADTSDDLPDDESGDDSAPPSGYLLKKEILGNNCPRLMYVRATFDGHRRLQQMTAEGCRLISRAEYEAASGGLS